MYSNDNFALEDGCRDRMFGGCSREENRGNDIKVLSKFSRRGVMGRTLSILKTLDVSKLVFLEAKNVRYRSKRYV